MGEEGVGPNRSGRKVEPGGEWIAAAARERNALNESHASVLPRSLGHERFGRKHSCPAIPGREGTAQLLSLSGGPDASGSMLGVGAGSHPFHHLGTGLEPALQCYIPARNTPSHAAPASVAPPARLPY